MDTLMSADTLRFRFAIGGRRRPVLNAAGVVVGATRYEVVDHQARWTVRTAQDELVFFVQGSRTEVGPTQWIHSADDVVLGRFAPPWIMIEGERFASFERCGNGAYRVVKRVERAPLAFVDYPLWNRRLLSRPRIRFTGRERTTRMLLIGAGFGQWEWRSEQRRVAP